MDKDSLSQADGSNALTIRPLAHWFELSFCQSTRLQTSTGTIQAC